MKNIDWKELEKKVNTIREEHGGYDADYAVEILLGEDWCKDAVEMCIEWTGNHSFVHSFLISLHPWGAMKYCYDIYKNETDDERRLSALGLLAAISDKRALQWIDELLESSELMAQTAGIRLIENLIFYRQISCGEDFIHKRVEKACHSPFEQVRRSARYRIEDHTDHKTMVDFSNKIHARRSKERLDDVSKPEL